MKFLVPGDIPSHLDVAAGVAAVTAAAAEVTGWGFSLISTMGRIVPCLVVAAASAATEPEVLLLLLPVTGLRRREPG